MTPNSPPTPNSPLSRLRERVGERALLNPAPEVLWKSVGRITPPALSAESRTESAPVPESTGVGADSVRDWIHRLRRTPRWHEQPPLPLAGEGRGEGALEPSS